jgi:hypothetical protein
MMDTIGTYQIKSPNLFLVLVVALAQSKRRNDDASRKASIWQARCCQF